MRFLGKLAIVGALILGVLWIYGRSMPRDHVASSTITLVAPPEAVYAAIRNIEGTPRWWSDVNAVRRLTGKRRESWEQDMRGAGPVQIEVTSFIEGQRVVTTILNDDQQDWGGSWTHVVRVSGSLTEVTVTEKGWIKRPLSRVMMRVRGGPHRTLDSYLKSLGALFGETVSPRRAGAG